MSTLNMDKGLNSQGDGFAFFQNLLDELVIEIFTRLSNSNTTFDTLNDLKSLGQCSTVCKRFNSLVCLVPALSIKHTSCKTLYDHCPKILNKFKHIRSLQVEHWSCAEIRMNNNRKRRPTVRFDAAYRPQSYCLLVVSYKKASCYSDLQARDSLMHSVIKDDHDLYASTREHAFDLVRLHHMLVSSIKDHNYLQTVVVTDLKNRGTFTLEKEMLVKLRNCSSINLEQVQGLDRSGFYFNLDFPFGNDPSGLVLNNTCFYIIEWSEKSADDPIHKGDADVDAAGEIPTGLSFNGSRGVLLKSILQILLKNPGDVRVNDNKILLRLLSDIKSDGNLL